MSYQFLDANGSILSADSSVVSGASTVRPVVDVGSVLCVLPITFSGAPSISGAVTIVGTPSVNLSGIPSISGTVNIAGIPSISGTVNVAGNHSISGTVNIAGNPSISGTVNVAGIPSISGTVNIGTIPGSVVSYMGGAWIPSVLNEVTRNDTLSSVLGADLTPRPQMGDALGRSVIKPFASEDSTIISYVGSVVSGSVTLIQASATGKRSYVTDYWVTNSGGTFQLVTIQDGSTSVLGFAPAPATGGSNSQGINIPLKTAPSQDLAWKATGTSSVVYLTLKGYQAQ